MQVPEYLIHTLRKSEHIVALTGAGISAESGIPTFRDAQSGLWTKYKAEELATPQAFERNPSLVWEWYTWRRELISKASPNDGHLALAEIEAHQRRKGKKFTIITQNVDGFHLEAGSKNVIELHGNIQRTNCSKHGHLVDTWSDSDEIPPRCPICNSMLRPDVVWFGENLPTQAIDMAWEAAKSCDVCFSIGTSGTVEPAASLPYLASQKGALIIEINPNRTPLTPKADFVIRSPSGQSLHILAELIA